MRMVISCGSKRPITVELLQRLNLKAIAEKAGFGRRWKNLQRVSYTPVPTAPQLERKSAAV